MFSGLDEQLRPEPRLCWDFETLQAHLQQQRRRQVLRLARVWGLKDIKPWKIYSGT